MLSTRTIRAAAFLPLAVAAAISWPAHAGTSREVAVIPAPNAPPGVKDFFDSPGTKHSLTGLKCFEAKIENRCERIQRCAPTISRRMVEQLEEITDPRERALQLRSLGDLLTFSDATLPEAVKRLQEASDLAATYSKEESLDFLALTGIAQLRLGETQNCAIDHGAESCIFPLSKAAQHKKAGSTRAAAATFTRYLEARPDDVHIAWLLNVAHMALGTYPKKVPARWLMEKKHFLSAEPFRRFRDVAGPLGLQRERFGDGPVVIGDFNEDSHPDLLVGAASPCNPLRLYLADGKGGFNDRSATAGFEGQDGVSRLVVGDYDNDGNADVFVGRGAWMSKKFSDDPSSLNTLLKGDGKGGFRDVTKEAGIYTGSRNSTSAAAWVDYDRDGWLDLFVCNEHREPELFRNQNGKFTDVIAASGISNLGRCKVATWGDVNNDGWPDLFLGNYGTANRLWINKKNGKFESSGQELLERLPTFPKVGWFFDYDNDGWLDLFVGAFPRNIEEYLLSMQGKKHKGEPARLFRNVGGKFEDVTAAVGLGKISYMTMAGSFGDLDNDGFQDLIFGTGNVTFGDLVPNVLLRNKGGKAFADATTNAGFGNLQKGHGVSVGDLNRDGHQDVAFELGGSTPTDTYFLTLLENPGGKGNWLRLSLEGTASNRSAVGALVEATIKERGKTRKVRSLLSGGGNFGDNEPVVHLGLGGALKVEELKVLWPNGREQAFRGLPARRAYRLKEGEELAPVPYEAVKFKRGQAHHHHGSH